MIDNKYFISVVIPNYNYEKYVGEAIKSVLGQSYANLEIIVVDDGSTDNSSQVIGGFGDQVRLIEQENKGLSAARNSGILAAKGDWIAFIDSDDIWHPKKLEYQVKALISNPDWSFVGANVLEDSDYPDYSSIDPVFRETCLTEFLVYIPMSGSDALVRKSCFDEVGLFDTSLKSSEDRDMWLRLASKYRGGIVDIPLWRYRMHPEQMNRDVQCILTTYKQVIRHFLSSHSVSFSQRRITWAHYFYSASISHRDDGENLLQALVYGIGSLLYAPETYHPNASTQNRLRSVATTFLRLLHLRKGNLVKNQR